MNPFSARRGSGLLLPALVAAAAACGSDTPPDLSPTAERGRVLTEEVGCASCHGGVGSAASVGPSWEGSWGTEIELDDGTRVRFDADYVIRSVREPDAQVRAGDWRRMPAYALDQLTDDELDAIVTYLQELGIPDPDRPQPGSEEVG